MAQLKRKTGSKLAAATLAVCLAAPAGVAAQPAREAETPEAGTAQPEQDRTGGASRQAPTVLGPDTTQDAQRTREQLQEVLRRLSPSVAQALKADPSLLTNTEYLSAYPELAAFLARHGEVQRDARFFVGDAETIWRDSNPRDAAQRFWNGLFDDLIPFGVFLGVAGSILWLLRTALDHRRWLRLVNRQTEIHNKLLDRFTSHEDLLAFMQSPAGQRFLQMAAAPDTGPFTLAAMPVGRILLAVQLGLVLMLGGFGMQIVSYRLVDVGEPFYVFGVLGIALGAGFILSAAASYVFSSRLGLFDALRPSTVRGETSE
ncbi:MAG: hypothetical protein GEU99_04015 [Luteitalea sp.]|nr:hypothetical protein [Luteitalea sp.]